MTNEIQKVREAIERGLKSARVYPDEGFTELSPCGRYRLEVTVYATADLPDYPTLAVVVVHSMVTGETIAAINRNDTRWFYTWISRDGHDDLLFPEVLEGQTVIDLTARRMEGFSSPDDSFIWTEFHPSPDKNKLAIIGCHWACPYQVIVYDFRNPLDLPLPTLAQFELPGNDAKFAEWVSIDSFSFVDSFGACHVFEV